MKRLFRHIEKYSIEDRLFVYILLFTIVMSVILVIENIIISYPPVANVKWVVTFFLALSFLYCMLKNIFVTTIQFIFMITMIVVMLPIGWLNSSVNNPFTVAYAFLFLIAILYFFEGTYAFLMSLLLVGVVLIMTTLTLLKPELFPTIDVSIQLNDSLTQIVVTFVAAIVMLSTFSREHRQNLKQLKIKNADLMYVIFHDELTGIFNRRYIFQRLKELSQSGGLNDMMIGMIDIDDFKRINDNYGHEEGDTLLKETASFIHDQINSYGFVGRYGGDEFIIILENEESMVKTSLFNELKNFSEAMHLQQNKASFSGGFVRCKSNEDLNSCLARADKYLYVAKKAGKNRFCIDGEIL